jgi:hypothetical protein
MFSVSAVAVQFGFPKRFVSIACPNAARSKEYVLKGTDTGGFVVVKTLIQQSAKGRPLVDPVVKTSVSITFPARGPTVCGKAAAAKDAGVVKNVVALARLISTVVITNSAIPNFLSISSSL